MPHILTDTEKLALAEECIRIRDGKAGGMAHPDTSTEYHKITQQAEQLREQTP